MDLTNVNMYLDFFKVQWIRLPSIPNELGNMTERVLFVGGEGERMRFPGKIVPVATPPRTLGAGGPLGQRPLPEGARKLDPGHPAPGSSLSICFARRFLANRYAV
jgi:hypothetical protein